MATILQAKTSSLSLGHWAAAAVGALVLALPALAHGQAAASDCPSREAVATAVRGLLNQSHIEIGSIEAEIELRDAGTQYAVAIRGRTREYVDDHRDCARRARVAAVFVALTIAPPNIGLPHLLEEPTSPTEPPPPRPTFGPSAPAPPLYPPQRLAITPTLPPTSRTAEWRFGAELGALAALAPRGEQPLSTYGAEARLVALRPSWGLTLGVRWSSADELILGTSQIRQRRYPVDLGLRWQFDSSWLKSSVDLAAQFAILELRQLNAVPSSSQTLVEAGVRVAGTLALRRSALTPYLRGFAEFVPIPRQLAVEPRGDIGSTSRLWLGATLGVVGYFN